MAVYIFEMLDVDLMPLYHSSQQSEYEHDQNRNDGAEWIHVKGDGRCLFAGEQGPEL